MNKSDCEAIIFADLIGTGWHDRKAILEAERRAKHLFDSIPDSVGAESLKPANTASHSNPAITPDLPAGNPLPATDSPGNHSPSAPTDIMNDLAFKLGACSARDAEMMVLLEVMVFLNGRIEKLEANADLQADISLSVDEAALKLTRRIEKLEKLVDPYTGYQRLTAINQTDIAHAIDRIEKLEARDETHDD